MPLIEVCYEWFPSCLCHMMHVQLWKFIELIGVKTPAILYNTINKGTHNGYSSYSITVALMDKQKVFLMEIVFSIMINIQKKCKTVLENCQMSWKSLTIMQ